MEFKKEAANIPLFSSCGEELPRVSPRDRPEILLSLLSEPYTLITVHHPVWTLSSTTVIFQKVIPVVTASLKTRLAVQYI